MDILKTISLITVISITSLFNVSDIKDGITSSYKEVLVMDWYDSGDEWDLNADIADSQKNNFEDFSDLYFIGSTDKLPLSYKVNEEMEFTVALYSDDTLVTAPYFMYEISADDGKESSGYVSGSSGKAIITASCSVPGFVRLKVTPCNNDKKPVTRKDIMPFEGSACADFDRITKSQTEPEDFDSFWETQKALLDSVPASATTHRLYEKHTLTGYDVYDVNIPCIYGSNPVSGYVTIPKNSDPATLKIRVVYMGYGVEPAVINTEPGYITFTINPHGIDNGMYELYYTILKYNDLSGFGFSNNEDPEESYFRNMILRDIQGIRYVKDSYRYYWNGKDIEVKGASMGAFQAAAVAALMKEDITKVILEIPWLCDLGSEEKGRLEGWRPDYCDGIRYYDTVSFGKRITCPTEIIAGLGDYTCPPSGVSALFNSLSCKKKITFVQNMTHSYIPPIQLSYSHD